MKSFMYVAVIAMLLVGVNTVFAQNSTAAVHVAMTVAQIPLAVTSVNDYTVDGLAAGQCYTVPADPTNPRAYPDPTEAISVQIGEAEIAGDPNAMVDVKIEPPTILVPTGGGAGQVHMTYDFYSAAWGVAGAEQNWFNPTLTPITIPLNNDGLADIAISGNPCADKTCTADTFEGDILIAVGYTGIAP